MATDARTGWQQVTTTLGARWAALGLREQRAVRLAALVIGAALVWGVALAPALRSLKTSATQSAQLATATERMQALQARAKRLQTTPTVGPQDSLKALQTATAAMGKGATLQVVGEQATVTLVQVSAQSLAGWLASEAIGNLSPAQAHLRREAGGAEPLWSGSLLFHLPPAAKNS